MEFGDFNGAAGGRSTGSEVAGVLRGIFGIRNIQRVHGDPRDDNSALVSIFGGMAVWAEVFSGVVTDKETDDISGLGVF